MRKLVAAVLVLAAGCGGATVPLGSDGGSAPGSCAPLVFDAGGPPRSISTAVGGVRTDVPYGRQFSCCPAVGTSTYTCTLDDSVTGAHVEVVVAYPPGSAPVPLHQGPDLAILRLAAPGGSDPSAWGGDVRFADPQPDPMGTTLLGTGTACSAAGSTFTLYARFLFRGNLSCP